MSDFLFVGGAADPEMAAIRDLVLAHGYRWAQATAGGKPVHPGNAYKADGADPVLSGLDATLVLVECGFTPEFRAAAPSWFAHEIVVDHHRPGDPGYGAAPENFASASSIGQALHLLKRSPAGRTLRFVAAADHCLEAAYRGKCPGVDPDELMAWRASSRAAFQKRPVSDVLADVEAARKRLRDAVFFGRCSACGTEDIRCHFGASWCPYCNGSEPDSEISPVQAEYADLRGENIPELPEAAAREGVAFLSQVKDRDGREKVVLMAAPPNLVERFLAGKIVAGLTDMYGDPARGFAGGYLAAK